MRADDEGASVGVSGRRRLHSGEERQGGARPVAGVGIGSVAPT